MKDTGADCLKKSYGRGAGTPMHCKKDQVEDAGLCYKPCAANFHGVGPVCWQECAGDFTDDCAAMCVKNTGACVANILEISTDVAAAVALIALSFEDPSEAPECIKTAVESVLGALDHPICPTR